MNRIQFRMLYRQFLLGIIDLELLAPQGDTARLLGQFAALLVTVSFWILLPAVIVTGSPPPELALLVTWTAEHFVIATTMLVVGLFAVLSWESMFPDRRDVMVLGPLPIPARTLCAAKVAAVATALSLTVLCLNLFPGVAAPFAFATALTMPPPGYDPALPPLSVADLKPVLDRDMTAAGDLGKEAGIAVGVVKRGERRVFTYGTAKPDSLFEIGSITKTFTALLLAQMAAHGSVQLDQPVRELLPPGIAAKPPGDEITLLDLATHHSGLPGMPDNFKPADMRDPFADYHAANLYAYVSKRGVGRRRSPPFFYSNLGFGLLGQALAHRADTTYANLVKQEITGPLGMQDTLISLSVEQRERLLPGHSGNGKHEPVHALNLDALAGAGAIRSTAGDMLTYLEAQLHPEKAGALAPALVESHKLRAEVSDGRRIALAWIYEQDSGIYQHSGATAGYTAYAFFYPKNDFAGIALINTGPNLVLGPEQLGDYIRQRLAGEPAVSLAPPVVSGKGGAWNWIRSFAAYWITLLAAGIFLLCLVLTIQGLAQLLPRQIFLRVSAFLQMACFSLFLIVYFLQPPFAGLDTLVENQGLLPWLPSYWFFAMFQALNGPSPTVLIPLAQRAWMALVFAICGAAAAYLICYCRTLRKIAEEPDILPGRRRLRWLPRFGNSLQTAVGQFAVRTLFRSRQHRVILSFYLGMALGLAIFISKAPVLRQSKDLWYQLNAPLLVASILMICGAVAGARIVFSLPLELRANWIFRVMPPARVQECLAASRRALYGLAAVPVWMAMAAFFFSIWDWRTAAGHVVVLGLLAVIVGELSLYGFHKIPFTCSYLPGKSYVHMAVLFLAGLIFLINKGAELERRALEDSTSYAAMIAILATAAVAARWRTSLRAAGDEALQFEDEPEPAIFQLGLHRDGVLIAGPSTSLPASRPGKLPAPE
jgi:CubicO group peptidase (beta-lactamase class C family)